MKQSLIKVQSETSHKILSSSLSWFGLGMIIVMSLGYGFASIPVLQNIFLNIASSRGGFIGLTILSIGLIIAIMFGAWRMDLSILIVLFLAFCVVESFYMAFIFYQYLGNPKLLLVFAIPAGTFLVMGLLGYFQIFNFGKIWMFLLIALIGLLIFGVVLFFIESKILMMIYSIIGYLIFTLYVGFDLWRISRLDKFYNAGLELSKESVTRFGLIFGLSLLIDFVQLVWFMARILR